MALKIVAGLACLAALASPATAVLMSSVQLSNGVKLLTTPSPDQNITLTIALTLENLDQLESMLKAVSTPGSPDYGKYLDKDDIAALFPPSPGGAATVTHWLNTNGVQHISQQGSNIVFSTTILIADKLLGSNFAFFDVEGLQKLRTPQYSVPPEVAQYIDLIHPTTYFGTTKSTRVPENVIEMSNFAAVALDDASNCSSLITPDCFRTAYGVTDYTPDPSSGSRVGFGSFLNESARLEDLHLYQRTYGIPQSNFSVVLINGGLDHQDPNGSIGEANLDAQFQNAMSYPLPMMQFITGGSPPFIPNLDIPDAESNSNEPYLEYYEFLMNQTNAQLPQVISNSYGDDEQTVPPDYAQRVCEMIGMMGLRGITILESSGDTGVGAPCMSNDGKNHTEFTPAFPGTCPCKLHNDLRDYFATKKHHEEYNH
jgi:tripeptidyl-peptidase I